jgi:hypothetical protein
LLTVVALGHVSKVDRQAALGGERGHLEAEVKRVVARLERDRVAGPHRLVVVLVERCVDRRRNRVPEMPADEGRPVGGVDAQRVGEQWDCRLVDVSEVPILVERKEPVAHSLERLLVVRHWTRDDDGTATGEC